MSQTIVVGAGMVGLSVAWHLQEFGHEVTVVDKAGVAAGSSWGNAGWLTPGKSIPLSNSSLWAYGPQALFDPDAAMSVPPRVDLRLWEFCARFMARAHQKAWDDTMAGLTPIDVIALAGFDEMISGGVQSWTKEGPFVVAFENEAQSKGFLSEIEGAIRHGQDVPFTRLDDPRELVPQLSDAATVAYRMDGQRFFEPAPFVEALAESVLQRGGTIRTGVSVENVNSTRLPVAQLSTGEFLTAETVVLATGAWLPKLARPLGVKTMVQAGRGYSFTVDTDEPIDYPVYLPAERLACTPYRGRFRIAGTMEFRGPDEPFQPRRIEAMKKHAMKMFRGMDFSDLQDQWVGSRPVTPDGLPLIGETKAPNVYVAGGHGMWGMVLGPATGKLLARQIVLGEKDPMMARFDPLR